MIILEWIATMFVFVWMVAILCAWLAIPIAGIVFGWSGAGLMLVAALVLGRLPMYQVIGAVFRPLSQRTGKETHRA
jgi:ABC-type transport system involved in cytochrome c biogenesis permease component